MEETKVKLTELLEYAGWTQEQLAGKLGVSFSTLNAWLNDHAAPHKSSREKIEQLYGQIVGYREVPDKKLAEACRLALASTIDVKKIIDDPALLDILTLQLTYHSNGIEGSTLTLGEVEQVLQDDKVLAHKTAREQLEARNHRSALYFVLDLLAHGKICWTSQLICDIHLRLMNALITNAGQWRQHGVRINGSVVSLEKWEKVPLLMEDLVIDLNEPGSDLIGWMAQCHSRFETIHPFSDGNGRTGRLILLAQALGARRFPPLLLQERKKAYYWYLEMAQLDHNYRPLSMLLAEGMTEAARLLGQQTR